MKNYRSGIEDVFGFSTPRANALGDLTEALQRAETAAQAAAGLLEFYKSLGAEHIQTAFGPEESDMFLSTLPDDRNRHMFASGLYPKSHVVRQAIDGPAPIYYGLDICPDNPEATEEGIALAKEAHSAFGQRTAILFPMHDARSGAPTGGVSVGFSLGRDEFFKIAREWRDYMHLAAFVAHGHMLALRRREATTESPLTRREREVLAYIAGGHRVASVAERLGIAEVTVNLHLKNARNKLGANTLAQAVAKGMLSGWIPY